MMQPTQSQVDEQHELERSQIRQGAKRLSDSTLKLENQTYGSATIYGISSIYTLLPKLTKRIDNERINLKKGSFGVAFKEKHQYLDELEASVQAAIALKITFDKVFGYKDGCNKVPAVIEAIGKGIENECQMRYYEKTVPGLLHTLKEHYWHQASGTQQRFVNIKLAMNRCKVNPWNPWPTGIRSKLGKELLNSIIAESGWFYKQTVRQGRKTPIFILPTLEFLDQKDKIMADAELFSPLSWPMYIPPKDWSNEQSGGYYLNSVMRGHDMVRRSGPCPIQGEPTQGEIPIDFLNKIQQVSYKLNPFTVNVAKTLEQRGITVGKFLPIVDYDLPVKPFDIETNYDARKKYRREAAEVMNKRSAEFRRSCRTRMTMQAVDKFKDRDRFYIPWSFDYRGRAYPIPSFLTPQDSDFGKALLRFADESYPNKDTEKWLAFQCATTYGLDKSTMDERLEWVKNNIPLITRVATNPIDYIGDWEAAEEPWQFLVACEEYYNVVLISERKTTGLMVATDATCSGLQILAGLARDKKTAQLVNVLPADRPQDAYKVVADKAKNNCPIHIQKVMDRKVVKRTVMTIPYNAKPYSNRSYIREALAEKNVEIEKEDLTQTVKAVRDAMNSIVPGPMKVMKWIEDEVSKALKRGVDELEWTTPSGFVVKQRIMKKNIEILDLQLLGRCQISIATGDSNEVDKARHKAATAPNLIHSLDASLLHLGIIRFDNPIALIHDSVLCRATDMNELSTIVRETYMHLFAENDYLTDFAHQIGAESEPPIIGDLEPESVIDSTYFFC